IEAIWYDDYRYGDYIATEEASFCDDLIEPPECEEALNALGRVSHSWQDFYAHAMSLGTTFLGADETWSTTNPTMESLNPKRRNNLKPASYAFPATGEHGTGVFYGNEGSIRLLYALLYTTLEYETLLPMWLSKCWCQCQTHK
ncbi:MAG: hypothetical protein HY762_08805, partial [Planctomycetes bacterium]|nr:hypothetical protein [Planctomycetota bacterium]